MGVSSGHVAYQTLENDTVTQLVCALQKATYNNKKMNFSDTEKLFTLISELIIKANENCHESVLHRVLLNYTVTSMYIVGRYRGEIMCFTLSDYNHFFIISESGNKLYNRSVYYIKKSYETSCPVCISVLKGFDLETPKSTEDDQMIFCVSQVAKNKCGLHDDFL